MARSSFAATVSPQGVTVLTCALLVVVASCSRVSSPSPRIFREPEDAVQALNAAAAKGDMHEVVAIFAPHGQELVDSSDPMTSRRNLEVYAIAAAEAWRLVDNKSGKELVIGNEGWPFPVPLVRDVRGWRFDTAAGKEEVLARRIGRNELKAIQICRTYVAAQQLYALDKHDGKPAGVYARTFRSEPGRQNGLYWPAARGQKRSPLGDLIPQAAAERPASRWEGETPAPFHGYYFRILTTQGRSAPGGAVDYVVNGEMSRGFALVAWPAEYDRTGVMTFVVNHDGVVREKDLGSGTDATARSMTLYDPDPSWSVVE